MIEMIEISKIYPHVEEAIAIVRDVSKSPTEKEPLRGLLGYFGRIGGAASAQERKKHIEKQTKPLPLFPVPNLDPSWEFPLHDVLYRGQHFLLLRARKTNSTAAERRAALLDWLHDPSNYREECRLRDEQANLHICPID